MKKCQIATNQISEQTDIYFNSCSNCNSYRWRRNKEHDIAFNHAIAILISVDKSSDIEELKLAKLF